VSAATPKVADYPFTTLHPHLGVVTVGEGERFVLADIPGLIEGAAEGAGLGTRFLGHIERCAALVHLIDATQEGATNAYRTVRHELETYSADLAAKPEIVALNKTDAMTPAEANRKRAALSRAIGKEVRLVSGVSGQGVRELVNEIAALVRTSRKAPKPERDAHEDWAP
ncbi:MAG TPA: GTPase, partial [Caulobacterales bacterium]|nr:GTPase [Caulobacterales bacterium]